WGEARAPARPGAAAEDAAAWIETLTPSMFTTMSIHQTLAAWLAALPEPVARDRPPLCPAPGRPLLRPAAAAAGPRLSRALAWWRTRGGARAAAAAWTAAAARALPAADDDARPARGAV